MEHISIINCFSLCYEQALASCPSLLSYLTLLENAFHNCRLPRVWNGCFDAPMLWAAKGPLIRALEDCMDRLQPRDSEEQLPARLVPFEQLLLLLGLYGSGESIIESKSFKAGPF